MKLQKKFLHKFLGTIRAQRQPREQGVQLWAGSPQKVNKLVGQWTSNIRPHP